MDKGKNGQKNINSSGQTKLNDIPDEIDLIIMGYCNPKNAYYYCCCNSIKYKEKLLLEVWKRKWEHKYIVLHKTYISSYIDNKKIKYIVDWREEYNKLKYKINKIKNPWWWAEKGNELVFGNHEAFFKAVRHSLIREFSHIQGKYGSSQKKWNHMYCIIDFLHDGCDVDDESEDTRVRFTWKELKYSDCWSYIEMKFNKPGLSFETCGLSLYIYFYANEYNYNNYYDYHYYNKEALYSTCINFY